MAGLDKTNQMPLVLHIYHTVQKFTLLKPTWEY